MRKCILLGVSLVMMLASAAKAQTQPWQLGEDTFKQGSFSANIYSEIFGDLSGKNVQIASQTFGLGYYYTPTLARAESGSHKLLHP